MRPWVGFKPITPDHEAGIRNEPPASLPVATGTHPAATAAAEPPDEPPGLRVASHGLPAAPFKREEVTLIKPNSGKLVSPRITKPIFCNC